jgi:hypothetical protein
VLDFLKKYKLPNSVQPIKIKDRPKHDQTFNDEYYEFDIDPGSYDSDSDDYDSEEVSSQEDPVKALKREQKPPKGFKA